MTLIFLSMTFNKLIRNTAVDSNNLINRNKVLKWHLIYISDHFDSPSTASRFFNPQPSNFKGCKAQLLPAYVGFQESVSSPMQMCRVHTQTQTNTHIL